MRHEFTCIGCPMGCRLRANFDENGRLISIVGQGCDIGRRYGEEEMTRPTRMVTSLMQVEGRRTPLSVKTSAPIPKELVMACAALIAKAVATPPVRLGDVMIHDVLNTGADIVATKDVL